MRFVKLALSLIVLLFFTGCGLLWTVPEPETVPAQEDSGRRSSVLRARHYERASLGPTGGRRGVEGFRYPPIDLIDHPEVDYFEQYFTGVRRSCISETLDRRSKYLPMIHQALLRYGLPQELSNIAFIESRYNPKIRSRDGSTVGMWQFTKSTARLYGLEVSSKRDERLDPVKATDAAARFLAGLYDSFGDWNLVVAAYNSGPYRVKNAVVEADSADVFEIFSRGLLSQTTREFVAKFLALGKIMNNLDLYGFEEQSSNSNFAVSDFSANKGKVRVE